MNLDAIRAQFPILVEKIHGKRLAYLDNAATTQKPEAVLQSLDGYYRHSNANVHRAAHELAARATNAYEGARARIARWLNAQTDEIVFTRGTTEGINLVARSYLQPRLKPGDEVLITSMEHHSDIVPWQLAGAKLVPAPVTDTGELDLDAWRKLISPRTRLIAVVHVSNALGTVNPVAEICREANARAIPVLVDGAQALAHLPMDVKALGADFYVGSAHKAYGPTGVGALYARRERLAQMQPWQGGGDMIRSVAFEGSTWNDAPYKFEAGTPDMAGAVGFAAALDWIESIGLDAIHVHEQALLDYGTARLREIDGLRLIGTARNKGGILSFVMKNAPAQDLGDILNREGVAIRAGHHCTMPLMQRFGISATARASLAVYNGTDDIDQLVAALHKAKKLLA
ncbi:MAG: SufS family cysteine desulfurase [Pseudomonadota bacterium]